METWLIVCLVLAAVAVMVVLFGQRFVGWLEDKCFERINRSITGAEEYEP
ncbi:hypothetical protein KJ866_03985 [Patescibacteria group bacterium]|nr:hypothetical protein [Patescibacteria group bacterium]MBU2219635.1 hypothetical protein [Patescibacteria group bacterium]MBU2265185.1 hypothetical protein [Patescibacteria group bacterium]